MDPGEPVAAPAAIPAPERWPDSLPVSPIPAPSDDYLASFWTPGEAGARQRLDAFLGTVGEYAHDRNRPDRDGTSRLSPHLHFGEISVRSVWHAMRTAGARSASNWGAGADKFLAEIGWREFSHYLLHHCPHMPEHALRSEFDRFPWNDDEAAFEAWATGRTGYPFVDAGMRQLTAMGWMHNRVRMVTASFLIKDLLLPWQQGARWFWENLVDADLANNSQGWQWTAGSGADAAPFFRVFNPVLQGEKFDPQGAYVRRWLPELAALPADWIHKPWQAPAAVLAAAGVRLRDTYPAPIVDHGQARARALQAFNAITTS
jgi:deoxyribodipyrimidine photo-lyase